MKRVLMTVAFAMFAFAGIAQAEEILIGHGTIESEETEATISTYRMSLCGIKAIKVVPLRGAVGKTTLGRVSFSYEPNQPWIFSAYTQASLNWVKVPQLGLGCLQRVSVNVSAPRSFPENTYPEDFKFVIYGTK